MDFYDDWGISCFFFVLILSVSLHKKKWLLSSVLIVGLICLLVTTIVLSNGRAFNVMVTTGAVLVIAVAALTYTFKSRLFRTIRRLLYKVSLNYQSRK